MTKWNSNKHFSRTGSVSKSGLKVARNLHFVKFVIFRKYLQCTSASMFTAKYSYKVVQWNKFNKKPIVVLTVKETIPLADLQKVETLKRSFTCQSCLWKPLHIENKSVGKVVRHYTSKQLLEWPSCDTMFHISQQIFTVLQVVKKIIQK